MWPLAVRGLAILMIAVAAGCATPKAHGDGSDSGSVSTWAWGCDASLLHFGTTLD